MRYAVVRIGKRRWDVFSTHRTLNEAYRALAAALDAGFTKLHVVNA